MRKARPINPLLGVLFHKLRRRPQYSLRLRLTDDEHRIRAWHRGVDSLRIAFRSADVQRALAGSRLDLDCPYRWFKAVEFKVGFGVGNVTNGFQSSKRVQRVGHLLG